MNGPSHLQTSELKLLGLRRATSKKRWPLKINFLLTLNLRQIARLVNILLHASAGLCQLHSLKATNKDRRYDQLNTVKINGF
jgi:hypothetical protein